MRKRFALPIVFYNLTQTFALLVLLASECAGSHNFMVFDDTKMTFLAFVSEFLGVIVLSVNETTIRLIGRDTYPSDFYAEQANSEKLLRYQGQGN